MKKISTNNILLITLIILVCDYLFLFLFKYSVNDLNISGTNILNIGNIISLLLFSLSFIGFILVSLNKKAEPGFHYSLLLVITLSLLLNIASIFIISADPFGIDEYFFDLPANKFMISVLVVARTFVQFYFIGLVWMSLFRREKWNMLRALGSSFILLVILGLFSFVFIKKSWAPLPDIKNGKQTAVVLGAAVWRNNKPSPLFEARIKKAYELYQDSIAGKILVTGANAPGEITEAEAAKLLLSELGVSQEDIIVENKSRKTIEQLRYIKSKYLPQHAREEIIIISDKFHLARASEICEFLNIGYKAVASDYVVGGERLLFYSIRESISLLVFWLFGV